MRIWRSFKALNTHCTVHTECILRMCNALQIYVTNCERAMMWSWFLSVWIWLYVSWVLFAVRRRCSFPSGRREGSEGWRRFTVSHKGSIMLLLSSVAVAIEAGEPATRATRWGITAYGTLPPPHAPVTETQWMMPLPYFDTMFMCTKLGICNLAR